MPETATLLGGNFGKRGLPRVLKEWWGFSFLPRALFESAPSRRPQEPTRRTCALQTPSEGRIFRAEKTGWNIHGRVAIEGTIFVSRLPSASFAVSKLALHGLREKGILKSRHVAPGVFGCSVACLLTWAVRKKTTAPGRILCAGVGNSVAGRPCVVAPQPTNRVRNKANRSKPTLSEYLRKRCEESFTANRVAASYKELIAR